MKLDEAASIDGALHDLTARQKVVALSDLAALSRAVERRRSSLLGGHSPADPNFSSPPRLGT